MNANRRSIVLILLVALTASWQLLAQDKERTEITNGVAFDPQVYDLMSGPVFLSTDRGRALVAQWRAEMAKKRQRTLPTLAERSTLLFTKLVTNDPQQDTEPAILSINLSGGVTRTAKTFIKLVNVGGTNLFRNYFATTSDFNTWTSAQLPLPAAYVQSGDPLMDGNIYTSGIAPLRMYTVGIMFQASSFQIPNAIGLWRSDNGGLSWSSPATVDSETANSRYFLDKPDVAVSWYSSSRGQVYAAYMKLDAQSVNNSQLLVRRSTDGGVTFGAASVVATGRIEAPQIVVSSHTGNVFVVWVDFNLNAIRMSWATSAASSWSAPQTGATGNMTPLGTYLNNNVRAGTVPMARFNWVDDSVAVVWHEFDSPTSANTDIYYTAYTASGWLAKKRVNAIQTRDQFMPSIDFDNTGNLMVMYYDRHSDSINQFYQESWTQIDPAGNRLGSGTAYSSFSNPNMYGNKFIGDYQDIWWWGFADQWGNRFNGAWISQIPQPGRYDLGDLRVTGIQ
jgi:hypothetical protein